STVIVTPTRYIIIVFLFFFSSRRRHTRSYGDWSSDVCSSDLTGDLVDQPEVVRPPGRQPIAAPHERHAQGSSERKSLGEPDVLRSEERRVGKEWRSRRSR